jgi:transposase
METKENLAPFVIRHQKTQSFDKRLIKEIVLLVEGGLPRSAAVEKYGMVKSTLALWMTTYGSKEYQSNKRCTYPLTLRRSVLRAIEGGMTISQARTTFDVKSSTAIRHWIRADQKEKYDLVALKPAPPMPRTPKKKSKDEVKALQEALAEAQLKIKALDTMIDIAEEQLKIDIRKKSGARQSEE